ncbi:hypothetical protein [Agrobacterium salinitolerans]|uniref:hypothetical protein n=1 Tax=Agrobacterium salinitolerans TaxID=1183413 RepID=UPI0022B81538|nr:hypothetical protein [Agrobacterium salinitolerans]MCZ7852601.1 hypothetical protein [Agrobacterium salinitolerans]MCZ7976248.1 hypothetical protein [Agrobacterium salinitolerans]
MLRLWQRITYYRHRSELWALDKAQQTPRVAGFPISLVVSFWWFVMATPVILPHIILQAYSKSAATIFLLITGLPLLLAIVLAAPWFFSWQGIVAGLMSGRSEAARKKEQVLMHAIDAYRAKSV